MRSRWSYVLLLCSFLLMAGCAGMRVDRSLRPAGYDWTMFGGSPTRANASPLTLQPPLDRVWEYDALAGITATPLVRDSVMVVATRNAELQAVHLGTGNRLGHVVLESAVAGTPVFDGATVIVATARGTPSVVAISLRRGERKWSASVGPIESSLLLDQNIVYVTTLEGFAVALNTADGAEIWRFESGVGERRKPIRSSPATDGTRLYFGGDDGYVYALDCRSGALRWTFKSDASIFASPVLANGNIYVGSLGGTFYALKASTGELVWKSDIGAPIYGTAAADGRRVYVGASDGSLRAFDLQSGLEQWRFSAASVINSAPLITGSVLYVGSLDRTLYALEASSGKELWRYATPGRVKVSPAVWGDLLLVTSEDKFIHALRPVQ